MNAENQTALDQSSAGGSFVDARRIVLLSAYLAVVFSVLLYSLLAIWPRVLPLAITSIKPDHGPTRGSTDVSIVGTGFADGLQVFFGDVPAKSITRKSENLLLVTPPDSKPSTVTIEIDSSDGHQARSSDKYVFDDSQLDTSKPPSSAQPQGPLGPCLLTCPRSAPLFAWACSLDAGLRLILIVVIVGSLGALIHVARSFYWYVGNRNLKSSWLLMYFLLPFNGGGLALLFFLISRGVSSAQAANVESSVAGHAALAALVGLFSQQAVAKLKQIAESVFSPAEKGKDQAIYSPTLKVTSIQPFNGPVAGGTKVVITGTGLSSVSRTSFGGLSAGAMTVDRDTQITVITPAHSGGTVDVEIATSSGQKASLPGAFTYQDSGAGQVAPAVPSIPLTVASVNPTSGPAAGGTQVTIRGNAFGPTPTVKIGGAPASSVSGIDSNSLSAVTPPGNIGVTDVEVTNSDGKAATLQGGFTFS